MYWNHQQSWNKYFYCFLHTHTHMSEDRLFCGLVYRFWQSGDSRYYCSLPATFELSICIAANKIVLHSSGHTQLMAFLCVPEDLPAIWYLSHPIQHRWLRETLSSYCFGAQEPHIIWPLAKTCHESSLGLFVLILQGDNWPIVSIICATEDHWMIRALLFFSEFSINDRFPWRVIGTI